MEKTEAQLEMYAGEEEMEGDAEADTVEA